MTHEQEAEAAPAALEPEIDALAEDAGRDSQRTCIVTREKQDPAGMIRFVLSPDAVVTADVARKLPGRGVWVGATRELIETAVQRKAFARAFRRAVDVAADLPARIDTLLMKRVAESLGLANKAGCVRTGFGRVEDAIISGRVVHLLHARDGAEDGSGKLDRLYTAVCRDLELTPRMTRLLTIDEMSLATGRPNVVHACLVDGNGARLLTDAVDRIERYRNEGPRARNGA